MKSISTSFQVPVDEAVNFACNSIVLGHHVIINHNCEKTAQVTYFHLPSELKFLLQKLREAGYTPIAVDMSVFRGGPQKFALRIA